MAGVCQDRMQVRNQRYCFWLQCTILQFLFLLVGIGAGGLNRTRHAQRTSKESHRQECCNFNLTVCDWIHSLLLCAFACSFRVSPFLPFPKYATSQQNRHLTRQIG
ncbi:uncharacterized protein EURHEDRAFT_292641 [Aspergillus ruber CBS 135680]|uniref:Uncharacterized protein n=1 Tax=Aspergillus ruber (strain CBS 135680) TaxID=1388766 RepID=A0A017S2S8_ASPRC|nr:uncharacterized protein EURHEDRAFT_292641 [Aspergillus ruber CBS 135680]EYE90470.1 hypothetical protein EURHEDRAFT_292641 [Aspergillus ruber CBS 135680]